jgi:hypothetical protein
MKRGIVLRHLAEIRHIDSRAAVRAGHETLGLATRRLVDSPADVLAACSFDQTMGHDFASSLNRSTPGAAGFLILSQALLGPDRYGRSRCLDTMPSYPSLQACGRWPCRPHRDAR